LKVTVLKAAAGGAGGSWYVLLEGLAALVGEVHPNLRIEVVEGGGVMNHAEVGSNQLPKAILNPPMTVAAQFEPRQAPLQPGGPLHLGAERYYREQGWL
jgi:TRAP-type uncharacterized transport system substrate-binding protein